VQLGDQGPKFFKKDDADLFEIVFTGAFGLLITLSRRDDSLDVPVKANRFGLSGSLPFRSTEKNGNVA
jgi:hypothetical protein